MPNVANNTDIAKVIKAAQRYERWALEELYNLYADKLFRFLLFRVKARKDAEDLLAATFERVLRRMHTFKGTSKQSLTAWMYQVTRNLLIDHYRRRGKIEQESLDQHHWSITDDSPGPSRLAETLETNEALYDAILSLTPVQQQVVILKFFEGMSNADVGAIIGKSEGAVKSLQHRALASLARFMPTEEKHEF